MPENPVLAKVTTNDLFIATTFSGDVFDKGG
jgi:hypothetical protein